MGRSIAKRARALEAEKLIGEIAEKRARAEKYGAEAEQVRVESRAGAAGL